MKKKIIVFLISFFIAILSVYVLLSFTDITKGVAEQTARKSFARNYPDFGEAVSYDCSTGTKKYYEFPWCVIRSYTVVFINQENDCIRMEISSYWPFSVGKSETFIAS